MFMPCTIGIVQLYVNINYFTFYFLKGAESDAGDDGVVADDGQEESDDDEAPDDIGFTDSKKSIMTQLRSAMQQVDADKRKKKEQRRKLDAQFKEQRVTLSAIYHTVNVLVMLIFAS